MIVDIEDLAEELRDLPLFGHTTIRGRAVRRSTPTRYQVDGEACLSLMDAIEILLSPRYTEEE